MEYNKCREQCVYGCICDWQFVKSFIVSHSAKIFEKVKQNYDLRYGVRLRLHSVLLKTRIVVELRNTDSYSKEKNTEGLLFSFTGI